MANNTIKVTEAPKIPSLNIGYKRPSMFSSVRSLGPKQGQKGKFNSGVFQTQHKGGPSGGK